MTTESKLTLTDNGYILDVNNSELLLVYESSELPDRLCRELVSDLEMAIDDGISSKFKITVNVEPIEDEED